mmetsp:Transcript_708/g.2069  ORF Transcript_708/g.2069 Transcript_708/m.2069 type:complete len:275 (-) Transcript_708:17-841(-)
MPPAASPIAPHAEAASAPEDGSRASARSFSSASAYASSMTCTMSSKDFFTSKVSAKPGVSTSSTWNGTSSTRIRECDTATDCVEPGSCAAPSSSRSSAAGGGGDADRRFLSGAAEVPAPVAPGAVAAAAAVGAACVTAFAKMFEISVVFPSPGCPTTMNFTCTPFLSSAASFDCSSPARTPDSSGKGVVTSARTEPAGPRRGWRCGLPEELALAKERASSFGWGERIGRSMTARAELECGKELKSVGGGWLSIVGESVHSGDERMLTDDCFDFE